MANNHTSPVQENEAIEATTQAASFNPFTKLSPEQITALAGSFNKQWRAAHSMDIAIAQTEFTISENDATFFAWLKSEADSVLDRNMVTDAVKFITSMLDGVAFANSTAVSLGLIEGRYNNLKVELRKTVGIRVRDFAHSKWAQVTATAILDKVYEKLTITEKDWMR